MRELGSALSGGPSSTSSRANPRHAAASAAAFSRTVREVAALVPEWRAAFPSQVVDDLGRAFASGDPTA